MSSANVVDLYESVKQTKSRKSGKRRQPQTRHTVVQPCSADEIAAILANSAEYPSPVRPVGSGSSITRCNQTATGTMVDMTALDRVLSVSEDTVCVQAGMRVRELAGYLAEDGLELAGNCGDPNRTVGGAVSSGSLGASLPDDGSEFASSVSHITLINGIGRRVEISEKLPDLLALVRMSYGLLGIIYSVKLRVRPIRSYTQRHSKSDFAEFVRIIPNLMETKAAVRASLFPFRDRAYIEIRYPDDAERKAATLPWKLRDWASNSAMPRMVRSVSKIVPIRNLRDPLIDHVAGTTHALFNNRLSSAGSNAAEQTGSFRRITVDTESVSCAWVFLLKDFGSVLHAYRKFCQRHYKGTGFRCDLPVEVWCADTDKQALLSPSFEGPAFGFLVRSSTTEGWDDYLLELAEFAAHFRATPLFNQTKGFRPGYASSVYGQRLQRFRDIRSRLDPQDRLLNQFFAEHIGRD